jgi:hypothetical protein
MSGEYGLPSGPKEAGVPLPWEMLSSAAPWSSSRRATDSPSGSVRPRLCPSATPIRAVTSALPATSSRTAANTSTRKRLRFCIAPPYLSTRRFMRGDRNWLNMYPWAAWSSMMSKPASTALLPAALKASSILRRPDVPNCCRIRRTRMGEMRRWASRPRDSAKAVAPAWWICIPATAPAECMAAAISDRPSTCRSL